MKPRVNYNTLYEVRHTNTSFYIPYSARNFILFFLYVFVSDFDKFTFNFVSHLKGTYVFFRYVFKII